jgi:serine/threonine protein kinase
MKHQRTKLQAGLVPKAKKAVNLSSKLSLSDFSLKAIRITKSGSIIYMAIHRKSGAIYALKSTRKSNAKLRQEQFTLELKLGLSANHPNITKIYGFFEESDNIYIVKEYLEEGGVVDEQKGLPDWLVSQYLNQLLFGVLGLAGIAEVGSWHVSPSHLAKTNVNLVLFRELSKLPTSRMQSRVARICLLRS